MNKFEHTIEPKTSFYRSSIQEVWEYRDLISLFVHRDFVSKYKQTILGPAWLLINPIAQTFIFSFIFGGIAGIPTNGTPDALFYMAGVTCWTFFSGNLSTASAIFYSNAALFSKVYYPRMVTAISSTVSNLVQFLVQLILLILMMIIYWAKGFEFSLGYNLVLLPLLLFIMVFCSLGIGMLLTAITTKYRDFRNLVLWAVQLLMYITPVVYPLSVAEEKLKGWTWIVLLNPMTSVVETFRSILFGSNPIPFTLLGYSAIISVLFLIVGLYIFSKVERNFVDTV